MGKVTWAMPKNNNDDYDLCVIGGGSAGLVVAAGGATLGAKVLLLEKNRLGGDCLYTGCVPSKSLLHCASVAQGFRTATPFGTAAVQPQTHLPQVMAYVQSVIQQIEPNDSPERFRDLGVEVEFGSARFVDPRHVEINGRRVHARHFVLATGSRPLIPPIPGIADIDYLTNETVFQLDRELESLVVLGAGPIGLEMSQAFARLGTQVTLVDIGDRVLPREDPDLSEVVEQQLRAEGIQLYLGHTASAIQRNGEDIELTVENARHESQSLHAAALLVATGRRVNTEDLGLEQATIAVDDKGRLQLNRRLRTSNKRVWACGDVAGPYQFTHMAEHQAGVVLRNTLFHLPAKAETRVVPWCTFTDPELARVGLSETEAKVQGIAHEVYRFPFADVDRARADSATEGWIKVLCGKRDRILGVAIVGSHAGELIHEYVLAMHQGLKLGQLSGVIHIYPTLAQINRRVADSLLKQRLTPTSKKWIKRLFRLRGN